MTETEIKAQRERDIRNGFFTGFSAAILVILMMIAAYQIGYHS